ncbi:DUF3231 family protein [Bacillus sp. FJAT-49736]|uniref:DUF3231 family protein n=1 Tax=Bacillus sp. FJAT-49736 TaxID=2833582 RepID=UPI001BC91DE7|nr:DUF3231 family protein [Bacillus sp. FJAT-49736]MBS4174908.1 DUF3231 family protein [Bacillus sp. FJAT-49736]
MSDHMVGLTAPEIGGLWSTYISESMSICMSKHMLKYLDEGDIKSIVSDSLNLSESRLKEIRDIFTKEKFPIPTGFTDDDLDLSAPNLFLNYFPLSFVYSMSSLSVDSFAWRVTGMAREDVRMFFSNCLNSSYELFDKAIRLSIHMGTYDRPAFIPYPDHVEFLTQREPFLSKFFESERPLNVLELTEIFFTIERNYFGLILLTGFIQIVKDEEIKKYLIKGKELTKKQIVFLNNILMKEDLPQVSMVNTEISTSTISPFSEKLILNLVTILNSTSLTFLGHALSATARFDLTMEYSKLIIEIMQYGKKGMDLLIDRKWFEEPPHAPNRKKLAE